MKSPENNNVVGCMSPAEYLEELDEEARRMETLLCSGNSSPIFTQMQSARLDAIRVERESLLQEQGDSTPSA